MVKNLFLDKKWLHSHLEKVLKKAGPRYTPKLNIKVPIAQIFDGIARTETFYTSIRKDFGDFSRTFNRISNKHKKKKIDSAYRNLKREVSALLTLLSKIKEFNTRIIPWPSISSRSKKAIPLCRKLVRLLEDEKSVIDRKTRETKKNTELESYLSRIKADIEYLYKTQQEIRNFEEFSLSVSAKLSNKPFLLLTGLAGTGKTHLLCDVVETRIKRQQHLPTVVTFGEYFTDSADLADQIIHQIGLKGVLTSNGLFKLLNQAGRETGVRSLIVIDALNETHHPKIWKRKLKKFIDTLKRYPCIALAISVRTGFEHDTLSNTQMKQFVFAEHHGFEFREWEAVNKFFNEFNLPLPEVPLLAPEFRNPLFLLLFCKAYESRTKPSGKKTTGQKPVFRGHEGATYIFENFIKFASRNIVKQFALPKGRNKKGDYVIWDTIIEQIAHDMVSRRSDRITDKELIRIVANAYPTVDCNALISALEKQLLLVKVPKYTSGGDSDSGFEYRFPFQKFSDHLIGRYIFKEYESEFGKGNKNINTAKRFFSKRRKLGKFISQPLGRGIIETLSIQCPEHLKGSEFIEVAPYLLKGHYQLQLAEEAFIESIIWRKPTAFSHSLQNTIRLINTHIIRSERGHTLLLNAFLSVAPIPEHPFNAYYLHGHLFKYSMANRDSWWSIYLHDEYGNKEAVDRLVTWAWSEYDKSHLSDESAELCAITLSWFLTTSNRFLRDKSTKALIAILTNRLNIVLRLLRGFQNVNDMYVAERIYAIAYGCALRSQGDKKALKALASWVYKSIFEDNKPPVQILLRDYARGIIECALKNKLKLRVSKKKIAPPYNSKWPKRVPTADRLKLRCTADDGALRQVWSSVMFGDFGRYELNSTLNCWSSRPLMSRGASRREQYQQFIKKLNKQQRRLYRQITSPSSIVSIPLIVYGNDDSDTKEKLKQYYKERKAAWRKFIESLQQPKRSFFEREFKPYIDDHGNISDSLDEFDAALAQRWLVHRVMQFGLKNELHSDFDRRVNYYRVSQSEQKAERLGKKYQWIAFHELLARIGDNFEFKIERWPDRYGPYQGPWQLSVRDIDPSCILKDPPNSKPEGVPNLGLYQHTTIHKSWKKRASDATWIKSKNDLPDPLSLIETSDDNHVSWLALESHIQWQNEIAPEKDKYQTPTRTIWYMIKSYIVKKRDAKKFYLWAKKQDFMGRWMPESHEFYRVFLGEYPWAHPFLYYYIPYYHHEGWTTAPSDKLMPAKILVTDDAYLSSGSSIDCSTSESIRVKLPAKWLIDKLRIRQHYTDGRFYSAGKKLIAFDPNVFSDSMPRSILINKSVLHNYLKKNGYSIIWTLLGEKHLFGSGYLGGGALGRLNISGAFMLNSRSKLIGAKQCKFKKYN